MRKRRVLSIISIVALSLIVVVVFYLINHKTLDEAINASSVKVDEIFHTTDYKGHKIIFYGSNDTLSVGLIEKTFFGYRWGSGAGGLEFKDRSRIISLSLSNLYPRYNKSESDPITIIKGVVYDDSIEKILIKLNEEDFDNVSIIETNKGRILYYFSNTPLKNYPDIMSIEDGTAILGWY